jgi:hypothetical protein
MNESLLMVTLVGEPGKGKGMLSGRAEHVLVSLRAAPGSNEHQHRDVTLEIVKRAFVEAKV